MSTIEERTNLANAEAYYQAMLRGDFAKMTTYLHDDVYFIGPLAEMRGKEAVTLAARNFSEVLQGIDIRSRFADKDEIVLVYDMTVRGPIGKFRAATLMQFQNQVIVRIELFYDGRLFEERSREIFEDSSN